MSNNKRVGRRSGGLYSDMGGGQKYQYHVASWWWSWGVCAPIASLASRKKDRSTPRDMFLETLSGICEAGIHLRVRTHTLSLLYFLFFLITSSVLIIPYRCCTLFSFPIMQREHENMMSNSGLKKSVKKRIGRCFVEFLFCRSPPRNCEIRDLCAGDKKRKESKKPRVGFCRKKE